MAKEKINKGNDTTNPPAREINDGPRGDVPHINLDSESPSDPVKQNRTPSTTDDGTEDEE